MSKIVAGIVSFNPDLDKLKKNICNIESQVCEVYIVDNASNNINALETFCKKHKVFLIKNNENFGIAKALNQMCIQAIENGFDWIITLDQDTIVSKDMINKMEKFTRQKDIGIICPSVIYEGMRAPNQVSDLIEYVYACMTSGSLTNLLAWENVGGFREEYFIDYVDNEFCMKLRLHGYTILKIHSCSIFHQLGYLREMKIFKFYKFNRSVHSPWRFYYMIRNNRAFISEYKRYLNVPKELVKLWTIIIENIIVSDQKKKTLMFISKGYHDAKLGILGKNDYVIESEKVSVIK